MGIIKPTKILIDDTPLIIYVISNIHNKNGVRNNPNSVGAYTKISSWINFYNETNKTSLKPYLSRLEAYLMSSIQFVLCWTHIIFKHLFYYHILLN